MKPVRHCVPITVTYGLPGPYIISSLGAKREMTSLCDRLKHLKTSTNLLLSLQISCTLLIFTRFAIQVGLLTFKLRNNYVMMMELQHCMAYMNRYDPTLCRPTFQKRWNFWWSRENIFFAVLQMHIVHKLRGKTFSQAALITGGVTVLGVFIEIGGEDNPAYQPLIESLQHIIYKSKLVNESSSVDGF